MTDEVLRATSASTASPHPGEAAAVEPALSPSKGGFARFLHLTQLVVMGLAAVGVIVAVAFFTVPKVMGWHGVIVLTGSMEPTMPVGSLAYIDESVSAGAIRPGDIITFSDPSADRHITHRVVEVVADDRGTLAFRTKGDANHTADETLVPAANLIGREVFDVPHVGNWSNWIREKNHILMILWLPAALVIAGELSNIYRDLRSNSSSRSAKEKGIRSGSPSPLTERGLGGEV
jgi:signal peptidase